ncbi:MAG: hypothetical protein DA330_09615, partial [Nitrososphaera sp.]|nr:hypothetical protein [Nitrososphaera sp.]
MRTNKEGEKTRVFENVTGGIQKKISRKETEDGIETTKIEKDLAAKQRLAQQKENDPAVIAARNQKITDAAILSDHKLQGRILLQQQREQERDLLSSAKQQKKQQEDLDKITNRAILEDYKSSGKLIAQEAKQQKKQQEDLDKITNRAILEDYKSSGKLIAQEAKQQKKQQEDLDKITNRAILEDRKNTERLLTQEVRQERKRQQELDRITNKAVLDDHRNQGRILLQQRREQEQQQAQQRNRRAVTAEVNRLQGDGFILGAPPSRTYNRRTGQFEEIQELKKITGNALRGYQVEVVKANLVTGQFNHTVLEGARASKAMGDSLGHAIAKVTLWSIATGTVFLATRGFYEVSQAVIELEKSTTLL